MKYLRIMALFNNYQEFAFCSIDEYIKMAKVCMSIPKEDKGSGTCYGMAALVLIASAMDAIGTFYRTKSFKTITEDDVEDTQKGANAKLGFVKEHFREYHKRYMPDATISEDDFIDKFYTFARCRATHNSVLGPKVRITTDATDSKEIFTEDNVIFYVHLQELLSSVEVAFEQTKREGGNILSVVLDCSDTGKTSSDSTEGI